MVPCVKCGKNLEGENRGGQAASISGSIMGDECTDSYYFCEGCGLYTVEVYYDPFLGEGEVSTKGPISKEEGDEQIRLIEGCPEPWNKKCRCESHVSYFQGWLD
jgi:hypothetical protein